MARAFRWLRTIVLVVLGAGAAALSDRAALSLRRSGLDRDAVALGDRPARRAHRGAARPDRAGAAARGDLGRGRQLLHPSRDRLARAARGVLRSRRHLRDARRLDHHPAGRQEPVPLAGAQLRAQGAGDAAGGLDRSGPAQAPRAWRSISTSPNGARTASSARKPAARHAFGKSARQLTAREAALLAAVLPSPTAPQRAPAVGRTCAGWRAFTKPARRRSEARDRPACGRPPSGRKP